MAILILGCLLGTAIAVYVSSLPFDFSDELAEAKRLGIVSLTILNDYPKSRDILLYALLILTPVVCSLGGWLAWSGGRRPALKTLLDANSAAGADASPGGRLTFWVVLLICCFASFNMNRFYAPSSDWALLGETGEHLAWANIILDGGTYARDFFCLYGPLWIYPMAWTMKLFGSSIVVYRAYGYGLELISYAIVLTFFYQTLRNKWAFVLVALCFCVIPHHLRFSLGLVPILLLYRYNADSQAWPFFFAGGVLGLSLLFSQEAGLCALLAMTAFLCLEAKHDGVYRRMAWRGVLAAIGCLAILAPVLFYFYQHGALGIFFESLYGYPKLVTLGFGALPFPKLASFLASPLASGAYFPYWMIGIYIVTAVALLVRLFLGLGNRDLFLRIAVLVFGLLLYRTALGRSDMSHFSNSSLPAFALTFLIISDTISMIAANRSSMALTVGRTLLTATLLVSLVLVIDNVDRFRNTLFAVSKGLVNPISKFTVQEMGVKLPQLPRGGIYFDPATAENILKIKGVLDNNTKEGEYVLFFPNEAAYYFLFNRRSPSRYVLAYFTVTTAQRMEMVADIEQKKPAYMVYSLDNLRVDNIPEGIQVPELVDYLQQNYTIAENFGNIVILKRKGL